MKYLNLYRDLGLVQEDDVFDFIISSLKPSNTLWSYFVNWEKVFKNSQSIEVELNILNYLIGKEDFDNELRRLIIEHPEIVQAIPFLLVRDAKNRKQFDILIDYSHGRLLYKHFDFSKNKYNIEEVESLIEFVEKSGLKKLFVKRKVKNLVDYMVGVEAGLDSNARKNRGGTAMENISEAYIKRICDNLDYDYLSQADANTIKLKFGYEVPVDKSSRRYDLAINTPQGLTIVEVNFYGGGGSKLKSTAGEYKGLQNVLRNKCKFVWITDGAGWKTTTRPLRETFNHNDYLINLELLERGALQEILSS